MDFFKSVFTEDPDPPSPTSPSPPQHPTSDADPNPPTPSPSPADGAGAGAWSFGGLIKNLATRSESVIETYRRDLEEFGSGLKKETVTLKEVANRAVKDLPSSIEISATKAQGAFQSIAEIVAQGKETLLAPDLDSDSSDRVGAGNLGAQSAASGRYSRFDAQLRAIQGDLNTYIQEPDDVGDYNSWKLGFNLGEKSEEIEDLMRENVVVSGIYSDVVPNEVDHEGFWCRYFYRVHRLQQTESVRANLVMRAYSKEEEELSWDVDDDDDNENEEKTNESSKNVTDALQEGNDPVTSENVVDEKKEKAVEPVKEEVTDKVVSSEQVPEARDDESSLKSSEQTVQEVKTGDSDASVTSVVLNQPSAEEEDLGWDEIEDLGSDDGKNVASSGVGSDRAELRKRLSAADDDEDLSWDIEDDDEPVKS